MAARTTKSIGVARFASDPGATLAALFAGADVPAEARRLSAGCEAAAEAWRAARAEQGALSRRIGEVRRQGRDPADLLERMRVLSHERRRVEAELGDALERLEASRESVGRDGAGEASGRPAYLGVTTLREDRAGETWSLTESPDPVAWDAFVRAHPARTAGHVHRFVDVAARAYALRVHRLAALDGSGAMAGVLPLVELDHRLLGRALVSLPWINYGGPLAVAPGAEAALMHGAVELARRIGCPELELREARARRDWPELAHRLTLTLALPDTDEALASRLGAKRRAQCAKAERAGAVYRSGGAELLDGFHAVLSARMRELGTPFHSRRFFAELLDALGDLARLATVEIEDRPVAAALCLVHADALEVSWASALGVARRHDPNMFLYRNLLREAIERGHDVFDFGRSAPDASTFAFKRRWGALPHPLYWHYWRADGGGAPDLDGDRAKLDAAVALWRRLPVWATRVIGPRIARGLR